MRLFPILFLSFLFSCNSQKEEQKTIPDTSLENPWTYINRISDTLQETEFSIFKSFEINLNNANKNTINNSISKYRIGQNKYLRLIQSGVKYFDAVGVIIDTDNSCFVQFGLKNHYMIEDTFFENTYEKMDSTFCNYILSTFNKNNYDYPNARFKLYLSKETNQNEVLNIIDKLANGYILFMNIYSKSKYKKPFKNLNYDLQSNLMKEIPFELNYDFYDMNRLGRKPEVPKVNLKKPN